MGEVIKFDFKNRKRLDEVEKGIERGNVIAPDDFEMFPAPETTPRLSFKDLLDLYRELEIGRNGKRYDKLQRLPSTLEADGAASTLVATYDNEQIKKILQQSTENDWVKKPAFYKALLREYFKRKTKKE